MATASSSVGRTASFSARYGDPSPWWHIDLTLVVSTLLISVTGTLMVFSATKGSGDVADTAYLRRVLLFHAVGVVAMVVISLIDYQKLLTYAWPAYGGLIFLLLAVLVFGNEVNGAKAWFNLGAFALQPAELGKIAVILVLAVLLAHYRSDIDLRRLGILLAVPALPTLLIMRQPDLGMVLIYVAIVLGMLLVGGVRARYLVALIAFGIVGVAVILNSSVLADYQKDRLTAFTDPGRDVQGVTYNVNQSQTAIASGGFSGQGYGNGRQTQLRFVPEQQTDFIFTVVGEELGFVGCASLLILYGIVVWRIWRVAQMSRDRAGQLVCVGVLSFLVFQVFENAGMTMQIMPVTGIPLPLVSYGGSSILTTFLALGLVQNIHMHRFR